MFLCLWTMHNNQQCYVNTMATQQSLMTKHIHVPTIITKLVTKLQVNITQWYATNKLALMQFINKCLHSFKRQFGNIEVAILLISQQWRRSFLVNCSIKPIIY